MRSILASIAFLLFVFQASHALRVERQCVNFTHSYCNLFNYSTATFPNPRGHETPEEAAREFNDFNVLLGNNVCHPKLGTLLCFIYFPVCNKTNFNPEMPLVNGFYPCQELCGEVHASICTNIIETHVGSWAPHLQCNYTDKEEGKRYYRSANKLPNPTNCINGIAPRLVSAVNECARGTHSCDENAYCIDTQNSYICVCHEGFVGDGRSCQDVDECSTGEHICHQNAKCTNTVGNYNCTCNAGYTGDGKVCTPECPLMTCETCKFRINVNPNTFKRNCFCYAAHINVTSYYVEKCNHVYSVMVKEQFDLRTPYNSTYFTTAPTLVKDEEITIITSPSHCNKCPELDVNKEYIIAGAYGEKDGSVQWYLEGNKNKALASEWIDKYDMKMKKWIEAGSSSNDRSLCDQCE